MKPNILVRFKKFINTTVIGGFAAILPLALIFVFFKWLVNLVFRYLRPVVELLPLSGKIQEIFATILVVIGILIAFFLAGLLVKSRVGRFLNYALEKKYLMKIPGYKVARETVQQFFGKNRSFFSEVVLVDIFNSGTLMTGFITDIQKEYSTIFVPTGPNPTSGNIYHVRNDKIIRTQTTVESGMKTIISCGAGSSDIFQSRKDKKKTP